MSNPILENSFNQSTGQNKNSLSEMWDQIKHSPNPEMALLNMFPPSQLQNVVNYIKQNGGDAKTAYYNMAAKMGVDPNYILKFLK
jgi:hypothetical protein